jgi:cysteinyl-tRNA synthetase
MALRLRNTLTREVEEVPSDPDGTVKMFTCGPTVYKNQHVGNMRTFLLADLIARVLTREGRKVRWVVNITDVGHPADDDWAEDKLALAAAEQHLSVLEIARRFEAEFLEDWGAMGFVMPMEFPRASDTIGPIIELIEELFEKGYAYEAGRDVAYDVSKFPHYGELSGQDPEALRASTDFAAAGRRSQNDFALWRGADPDAPLQWDSPWGRGYPGWHIEDTAIAFEHLGRDVVHVHTGGEDLRFPHHEAEIAQAEAVLGRRYVLEWVHGGHVTAEGRKMAKSTGNVLTLSEVRDQFGDVLALRYLFLTSHYRSKMNVTAESLDGAVRTRRRLVERRHEFGVPASELGEAARSYDERFDAAVSDDLDTPSAIALLQGLVSDESVPPGERAALMDSWDEVFGLQLAESAAQMGEAEPDAEVNELARQRDEARARKDWAAADELRDEIERRGYTVRDSHEGTRVAPVPR